MKGEFLLGQHGVQPRRITSGPAADEAEACFQQANALTRDQEVKKNELRTTVSLARLWKAQGRGDEARHALAEIYGWFTEGIDTQDSIAARHLLEEHS